MLGNITDAIFQKSFQYHYHITLNVLEVIQNETLSGSFLVSGILKSHIRKIQMITLDVPPLMFVF
jgi:hypothetical protein